MKYEYSPKGVCSYKHIFEIENDILVKCEIIGGCSGNLQGISKLITGMKVEDIILKLEGIRCGFKPTSCPDQIAQGLKEYLASTK